MKAFTVTTRRKRNRSPFKGCPRRGRFQASGNPRPTTHPVGNDLRGANRIVHRVKCHGSRGCAASGVNWVRIYKASVTVSDRTPPLVAITGGALASGRWVSGEQVVQYAAADNVGVRRAVAVGGNGQRTESDSTHVTTPEWFRARTESAGDRSQHRAAGRRKRKPSDRRGDRLGWQPRSITTRFARVDNTPPARSSVGIAGGEGWRRTAELRPALGEPDERDRAPIAAAHHRLCHRGKCAIRRDTGRRDRPTNRSGHPPLASTRRRSGARTRPVIRSATTSRCPSCSVTTPSRRGRLRVVLGLGSNARVGCRYGPCLRPRRRWNRDQPRGVRGVAGPRHPQGGQQAGGTDRRLSLPTRAIRAPRAGVRPGR